MVFFLVFLLAMFFVACESKTKEVTDEKPVTEEVEKDVKEAKSDAGAPAADVAKDDKDAKEAKPAEAAPKEDKPKEDKPAEDKAK
jgi:hypothetical protein